MNSFDFRKSLGAKGRELLPQQLHIVKSAFVKDRPQTLPSEKQVMSAGNGLFISTIIHILNSSAYHRDPLYLKHLMFGL